MDSEAFHLSMVPVFCAPCQLFQFDMRSNRGKEGWMDGWGPFCTVPESGSDLSALQLVSQPQIRHRSAPPRQVEGRAGPGDGVARDSRVSHLAARRRVDQFEVAAVGILVGEEGVLGAVGARGEFVPRRGEARIRCRLRYRPIGCFNGVGIPGLMITCVHLQELARIVHVIQVQLLAGNSLVSWNSPWLARVKHSPF